MREKTYLKKRYAAILSSTGMILLLAGGLMMTPLLFLLKYPEEAIHALAFVFPAVCLALVGTALWKLFRNPPDLTLSIKEGGVIVLLSWIVIVLFSTWPFISGQGLSFSRALFESMSGWTTTGLSVVDVTRASHLILFWRSLTQYVGGAGLAIIMMSAIVGPAGVGISSAEGRSDQLVPNVRKSARLVLILYTSYAVLGTIAYQIAGLTFFDAINHAMAAVSTGGFSTQAESIGHWNSVAVEAVSLPLMFLGNLSFVTAWLLWRGKLHKASRNGELRLFGVIVFLSVPAMFLLTSRMVYPQLGKSIRVAVFETLTAITTTGFSTTTYGDWNSFGFILLASLMLVGGGTCSTSGGIKQFRVYLLGKLLFWEIKRYVMPQSAILEPPIFEGNRRTFMDDTKIRRTVVFVLLYLLTLIFGVMILSACGFSIKDSIFEFTSALGTVGLSVGVTTAQMPDAALWAEIFAMFLGRLEFIVVIISIIKLLRDGQRMLGRTSS